MQRQKTIAKWLAVVLLLTVAVACYVVLSAILPNSNQSQNDVAGAIQPDNASDKNVTPDDNVKNDNDVKIDDTNTIAPSPVFSALPRNCESVRGASVAHVGGEGADIYLDNAFFASKTIVVFKSESEQYDVNEKGLHLAVFDGCTLEKTLKIADENESYLCLAQSKSGLVIFTCDEDNTHLRLLSSDMLITARSTMRKYSEIATYTDNGSTYAMAYDGKEIQAIKIKESLDVEHNNFMYPTADAEIKTVIPFGEKTLVFLQNGEDAVCLTYTQKYGFKQAFIANKQSILQILPVVASEEQTFKLLAKGSDKITVYSLSDTLALQNEFSVEGTENAVLFKEESCLVLLCDDSVYRLCNHLDFMSNSQIEIPLAKGEAAVAFGCLSGYDDLFYIECESSFLLCKFEGDSISEVFSSECVGKIDFSSRYSSKNRDVCVFTSLDAQSEYGYMSFGKSDAFFITISITN